MLLATSLAGGYLRADPSEGTPAPGAPKIEACATDPDKLGLSRVVEIDETGGPEFGGGRNSFLKDGEVILTFDDGPLRPYTRPVLKALAAHCTKATFFMVGRMAQSDPAMVREVAKAGHTIGSHTFSHKNLKVVGVLKGRQELEMGLSAVSAALGAPVAPFFRFPFLAQSRSVIEYAKSRNISVFSVDIDSKDYLTRDPKVVHAKIMSQLLVQRKGIILMHDIQPSTAGAIMGLLDELHKRGFKVVHIVPKAAVTTIATYDSAAGKALAGRAAALAAKPLSDRSMVWTMESPGKSAIGAAPVADAASDTANVIPGTPTQPPSTAAPAGSEVLPWSKPAVKKAPESKPAKPARAANDQLPWQPSIFNY